jgi:DinB superfamily
MLDATLDRLLASHRLAADELIAAAQHVAPERWGTPRGPGKWTPGQEVTHIILTCEAFARDLRGETQMRLVGTRWKRFLWRAIGLTSILHLRKLPKGARAPRESRPPDAMADRASVLAALRTRVDEFETVFAETWRVTPRKRLTHPYFGTLSLRQAIATSDVHLRHHAAFLRSSASPAAMRGAMPSTVLS